MLRIAQPFRMSFAVHGHRGCRGYLPENSVHAFRRALEAGAEYLELDVFATADGRLAVCHDPVIMPGHFAHAHGRPVTEEESNQLAIYLLSLHEVQTFTYGHSPHPQFLHQQCAVSHISSLAEVAHLIAEQQTKAGNVHTKLNIEVKSRKEWDGLYHPPPHDYAAIVLNELIQLDPFVKFVVQSFDVRLLNALHRLAPEVNCALLADSKPAGGVQSLLDTLQFVPWGIALQFQSVDAQVVSQCRNLGIELMAWTVNEESEMQRLAFLGVSHIITDYPETALALRNALTTGMVC